MKKEKTYSGIIYKITNIQNNKCYIGYTTVKNYLKYIDKHFEDALLGKKKTKYFYNAIRKYGKQNFKIQILGKTVCNIKEELKKQIKKAEIESIWLFRSFGSDGETFDNIYGYNITKGGDGGIGNYGKNKGMKHTQTTKDKMSKSKKGKRVGEKHSVEQIEKQIATYKENNKNGKHSKKMSVVLKATDKNKNRIWVFIKLGNVYDEQWIDKNELQLYLDKGFNEGRKPEMKDICNENFKKSDKCKDRLWINKNGENKRVKKQDLEKFLSDNWKIGVSNTILNFEVIKDLLDQKLSYTKVAKQLDVNRGYLIKFVKNYNIDFYNESLKRIHKNRTCSNFVNSKRYTGKFKFEISNELLLQMKQERDSGLQFKQLAEKYNITWWIISRRLKTLEANINE